MPSAGALDAIRDADLVVLGPGSLYTSVLPVLLVPEVRTPSGKPRRCCIYICNVATQAGETAGYDLSDHVEALIGHTSPGLIDVVLANDRFDARVPRTGSRSRCDFDGRRRSIPPRRS